MPPVSSQPYCRSSLSFGAVVAGAVVAALAVVTAARAAVPFTSATVTRVENKVSYGENRDGRGVTRAASVADIVRANNFLLSEAESRAELQYPDGSLVRIGQNTVFTFDADSRTLSLEKGSLLFHIPKGSGGGAIKTPSLTAAITGTTGKVSVNIIAIIEGVVKLVPSGRLIHAGEFGRRNGDGTITIANFDPAHVNDGALVNFNGLMPGFVEAPLVTKLEIPDLRYLQVLQRTQNLPSSVGRYFVQPAENKRSRVVVPSSPGGNNNPGNY